MLSRIAENLYWLGRYVERAENTARWLDVNYYAVAEAPVEGIAPGWWGRILRALEVENLEPSEETVVQWLAFDLQNPSSIRNCIWRVRENARTTRFHLNLEIWEEVNRLYNQCYHNTEQVMAQESLHEYCVTVREASHQMMGIAETTLPRDLGFYFMRLGRYLERADNMLRVLQAYIGGGELSREIEVQNHFNRSLLRSVGALEAYRKVYHTTLELPRIGEFLLLNSDFPRSVRFCVDGLKRAAEAVRRHSDGVGGEAVRKVGKLAATLEYLENANQVFKKRDPDLEELLEELADIHAELSRVYFGY
ncbi:MAG: alpha-E domain-containing protein [Meiothermus sp.]|uniref:alpha-E domain-containing protein n=1 Tax=Meiothermus sp. TaxID=1955249 RepID=UPI0025E72C71|nr:alpha-E domain-containing protein [Meiothermus sp.]MCS7067213.1 alpha-E domain-containing protein [Meiothermus sp.]MCX7600635.1 alpha-E domain-containing protein [Meiothermus sp.]MDW8424718.1 alpha-E domain-containing protein [Meiothermus sp.]